MTKRELLKLLKKAGWELVREGKHEVWGKDGQTIPIPRYKGIFRLGQPTTSSSEPGSSNEERMIQSIVEMDRGVFQRDL